MNPEQRWALAVTRAEALTEEAVSLLSLTLSWVNEAREGLGQAPLLPEEVSLG